jgi:hypothetical protein
MNNEQLKTAHSLLREIEQTEKLLATYEDIREVVVGIGGREFGFGMRLNNQITLTAAEIRAPILEALTARINEKRAELKALGVS